MGNSAIGCDLRVTIAWLLANLYLVDLSVVGAVKRALSLSAAFEQLVGNRNMVIARALLRMQIDTEARLGTLRLVDDWEAFAKAVLAGTPINRMKDRAGKKMTDAYLVSALSAVAPWLEHVYRETCRYVHMSESFIFAPIQSLNEETRVIQFLINEEDTKFPDWSWLEVIHCFRDTSSIVVGLLEACAGIKREAERQVARE